MPVPRRKQQNAGQDERGARGLKARVDRGSDERSYDDSQSQRSSTGTRRTQEVSKRQQQEDAERAKTYEPNVHERLDVHAVEV